MNIRHKINKNGNIPKNRIKKKCFLNIKMQKILLAPMQICLGLF